MVGCTSGLLPGYFRFTSGLFFRLRSIGDGKNVTNEDIEAKGKLAAELTTFCKDFMTKTSAQEAVAIQSEVWSTSGGLLPVYFLLTSGLFNLSGGRPFKTLAKPSGCFN